MKKSNQKRIMKIPKKFKLFGLDISVEYDDELFHKEGCFGIADYRYSKIILQPINLGNKMTDKKVQYNFLHELVHFVLYYGNGGNTTFDKPPFQNEDLVDIISGLFHQFLDTAEYE